MLLQRMRRWTPPSLGPTELGASQSGIVVALLHKINVPHVCTGRDSTLSHPACPQHFGLTLYLKQLGQGFAELFHVCSCPAPPLARR